MEDRNLIETWGNEKHVPENKKLNKEMISEFLKPKVSKVNMTFTFNLLIYLGA